MSLGQQRKQQCEFLASTVPLMQFEMEILFRLAMNKLCLYMSWCVFAAELSSTNTFISSPFNLFISLCCLFHTDTNLKLFLLILKLATLHHHSGTDLYIIAYLLTTGYSGDGRCTCTYIILKLKAPTEALLA